MIWHLAALWETIADAIPDAPAAIAGASRRNWGMMEQRAAALAGGLTARGIKADAKIAIHARNSVEFLEAYFAVFKARAVPVNVNYRYGADELEYLFDNADVEAVICDDEFAGLVAGVRRRLPKLRFIVRMGGQPDPIPGCADYEEMIAQSGRLPRAAYREDDVFMLYTGGTTGLPKGVMYRHGDIAQALMFGFDLRGLPRPTSARSLAAAAEAGQRAESPCVSLVASPLMHGTGLLGGAFAAMNMGGAVVTLPGSGFDASALWRIVERERVTDITIVGDVFARPMLAALREARTDGRELDLSSVGRLFSSGTMFSSEIKHGLLDFMDVTISDSMGASEGSMATSITTRSTPPSATAVFQKNPETKVFKEDGSEVVPGSDEIGLVANGGTCPIGYYKDPVKSAATFRVIDGHRYSFPGDYAKLAADGSVVLLGRQSSCINTGGEKVFPEEVEQAIARHPSVEDCLVVGVPDERFGQRVAVVLALTPGRSLTLSELDASVRQRLAGYKIPRDLILVDEIVRGPNGKPDYRWAVMVAGSVDRANAASGAAS